MRVLVLGGNRYIGLSLVRELHRRGHHVTVANSHEVELPPEVERVHVDRRSPGALVEALAAVREHVDAVFDNTAYEVADLEGVCDLFDGRVAHFVFTSSVAVYRRSFVQPIDEGFAVHEAVGDQPLRRYAVGKVACERYLSDRHARTGFPATSLRVTHTVGPRSPLATREPSFFARLERGLPILVPGDGLAPISTIHIDDVAGAMIAAASTDRSIGETYNVAGSQWSSVLGAIHLMARAVGVAPDVVHVPASTTGRDGRPLVHWHEATTGGAVYSTAKALDHLDWRPAFDLRSAYADSWRWYDAGGRDAYRYDTEDDAAVLRRLRAVTARTDEGATP